MSADSGTFDYWDHGELSPAAGGGADAGGFDYWDHGEIPGVAPGSAAGGTAVTGTETATGSDTATITVSFTVTETAVGSDGQTVSSDTDFTVTETAAGADAATIVASFLVTETATGSDTATITVSFTVTETAAGVDSQTAGETVSGGTVDAGTFDYWDHGEIVGAGGGADAGTFDYWDHGEIPGVAPGSSGPPTTTVTPATVGAVATVPAVSVSAGDTITVAADVVAAVASVHTPTISLSQTATPSAVAAVASVLAPTIIATSAYAAEVLGDSPLVYWKLDEPSGTSAADATGNGYTGTYPGTVTLSDTALVQGSGGSASNASFAGQIASSATTTNFNTALMSVEMWTRPQAGAFTGDQYSVKLSATGGTSNRWSVSIYGLKRVRVLVGASQVASWDYYFDSRLPYHVVVTHDGTNFKAYVNGVSQGTVTAAISGTGSKALIVGGFGVGTGTYSAMYSDVAVYDYVLTGTQVGDHYTLGNDGSTITHNAYTDHILVDVPILAWSMDEIRGSVADDDADQRASTPITGGYLPGYVNDATLWAVNETGLVHEGTAIRNTGTTLNTQHVTDHPFGLNVGSDGSAEGWFQIHGTPTQNLRIYQIENTANTLIWGLRITSDLSKIFLCGPGYNTGLNPVGYSYAFATDTTYHIVAAVSETGGFINVEMFVNGTSLGTDGVFVTNYGDIFYVGYPTTGSDYTIDQVAYYDYTLTSAQIRDHYGAGLGNPTPFTVAAFASVPAVTITGATPGTTASPATVAAVASVPTPTISTFSTETFPITEEEYQAQLLADGTLATSGAVVFVGSTNCIDPYRIIPIYDGKVVVFGRGTT